MRHCRITINRVFAVECISRRIEATAATQGVYNNVKVKKLAAESVVKIDSKGAPFKRTPKVLTTASFAMKPVINEVETRQSPNPSGRNTGAIHCPIPAKRLFALSETIFSRVSKLCRNQMITLARKIQ